MLCATKFQSVQSIKISANAKGAATRMRRSRAVIAGLLGLILYGSGSGLCPQADSGLASFQEMPESLKAV
jgi:hypothetical protein